MCVWAFSPTAPLMAAEGRGKKKKGRIRRIEKLVVEGEGGTLKMYVKTLVPV